MQIYQIGLSPFLKPNKYTSFIKKGEYTIRLQKLQWYLRAVFLNLWGSKSLQGCL